MSEELDVLKEVARRLERAGIAYMITGSIAANFYTVPRMTRDIDIVVELGERDVSRFISLFENDYYLDAQTVEQAVRAKGMFNLIQHQHVVKVDFVVRKDSPYRRREFARRKRAFLEEQEVYFVAAEDLILSKLAWAKDSRSEMQLNDVRNLLRYVSQRAEPKLSQPLGQSARRRISLSAGEEMKDTPSEVERKFCRMLMERSGEERLKMGCSMHATARALVIASIPEKNPDALTRALFLRFYGHEFEPNGEKESSAPYASWPKRSAPCESPSAPHGMESNVGPKGESDNSWRRRKGRRERLAF